MERCPQGVHDRKGAVRLTNLVENLRHRELARSILGAVGLFRRVIAIRRTGPLTGQACRVTPIVPCCHRRRTGRGRRCWLPS